MPRRPSAPDGTAPDIRPGPIRVVRIIARLNIGGPAIQAITLTRLLEPRGYVTELIRGSETPDEGNMDDLASEMGVQPTLVASLRRDAGGSDLVALVLLVRILRREQPLIVHTHAAKAGTLGRVAALIAFPRRRPLLVHTFHGHSLTGYFSPRTARVYGAIERSLARRTDALVAVAPQVRDDLVRLRVAGAERFTVVPLGFDLASLLSDVDRDRRRAALRSEWGLAPDDEVVTLIARLVPIKRVDRFLRVAALLMRRPRARFVVVGGGELHDRLVGSAEARALGDRLHWVGFRRDIPDVCVASDVIALTSDNEGTPVSLIEAQAARVPVVSTDVGGVGSVVLSGSTGLLADPDDLQGLADAIAAILENPALALRLGSAGRAHALRSFGIERLIDDMDRLYRELLAGAPR